MTLQFSTLMVQRTLLHALSCFGLGKSSDRNPATATSEAQISSRDTDNNKQTSLFRNVQLDANHNTIQVSAIDIKDHQGKDEDISQVLTWFESSTRIPRPTQIESCSLKAFFGEFQHKKTMRVDGVLYRKFHLPKSTKVYYQVIEKDVYLVSDTGDSEKIRVLPTGVEPITF